MAYRNVVHAEVVVAAAAVLAEPVELVAVAAAVVVALALPALIF